MKTNKKISWFLVILLAIFLTLFIIKGQGKSIADQGTFSSTASLIVNEDKVGAKVTLKEAIHGTDGIVYRYILKTDCPSWDYEDRYATRTPISWATDDTAAVEVLIYDAQVRYEGTAYASGTYYTVPMFGGLSSEDIPLEDWEEGLMKQAYMVYVADMNKMDPLQKVYGAGAIGVTFILTLRACIQSKKKKKKEEDPTDFLDR